ncbi:hypothetical protein EV178_003008 [Coemansia sp. RSA 1646]|nr:hypothetical protein EV178_003008 [Coemansia sp. RSA 1646]KAJ2089516.1 hypothetical protein IW138_003405 [Coemansia sp. RSA 986]
MSRILRYCSTAPRSISGQIKAVTERHKTPLALSVASGLQETERIKQAAKQKVAWQQAQPKYAQYSDFLTHAINRQQWQRIHVVLSRMLVDSVRWGKPTYVEPCLLDRCTDDLLRMLVDGRHRSTAGIKDRTLLDSANYLTEIAWRTNHDTAISYPKWELVAVIAGDLENDRGAHTRALRNLELAVCAGDCVSVRKTLSIVLESPRLSARLLSGLFDICTVADGVKSGDLLTSDLVAAFYLAAQRLIRLQPTDLIGMTGKINDRLGKQHDSIIDHLSKCEAEGCPVNAGRTAVSLAHLHLSQTNIVQALKVLSHFDKLSVQSRWPMGFLSQSVGMLVAADKTDKACDLLLSMANEDHKEFMQIIQSSALLSDNISILRALIDDELAIRLHIHKTQPTYQSTGTSAYSRFNQHPLPPMTAFFAPGAQLLLKDHGCVEVLFKKYYASVRHIIQTIEDKNTTVRIATILVSEASAWMFRLQSPAPLLWLTQALATRIKELDSNSVSQILLEYTRALCNFKMLRHVATGNVVSETTHTSYANTLNGYRRTREIILREYLRHGIEPPPEALATFAHHTRMSGKHREAQGLAAVILPHMLPQLTGSRYPGQLAVRAYYEWMLRLCGTRSRRRLLQLFAHLMSHHGVDSFRFKSRLIELTVCTFLRHEHFHGMGFYQLERVFVKYVARPWFPVGYLDSVRPRFWALYMFLRRRKYIPRLRIRPYQFRTTRKGSYEIEITAIPSEAKMKAQRVDFTLSPVVKEDIDIAVDIFMESHPPKQRGLERFSVTSMIDRYSKLVASGAKKNPKPE